MGAYGIDDAQHRRREYGVKDKGDETECGESEQRTPLLPLHVPFFPVIVVVTVILEVAILLAPVFPLLCF